MGDESEGFLQVRPTHGQGQLGLHAEVGQEAKARGTYSTVRSGTLRCSDPETVADREGVQIVLEADRQVKECG